MIWLFRNKSTLSLCFAKTPTSSSFIFYIITSCLSPSSSWSKPQWQHHPQGCSQSCLGSPRELQGDKDRHTDVLEQEHQQLEPTEEQDSIERLLSTHTSSVVTAGRGISFFFAHLL